VNLVELQNQPVPLNLQDSLTLERCSHLKHFGTNIDVFGDFFFRVTFLVLLGGSSRHTDHVISNCYTDSQSYLKYVEYFGTNIDIFIFYHFKV